MRVLVVTAEVYPFAKTGGLADVSAALPRALSELGMDVRVLMPAYPQALANAAEIREIARLGTVLGFGGTRLLETFLPQSRVPLWLVDCPDLYNRCGGPYQDLEGMEWPDNAQRFALLNHVAAGIANEPGGRWKPDIVHANDWHAGLLPLLVDRKVPVRPAVVLTIHNLAYQGLFGSENFERLELSPECFGRMEYWGKISYLKAGISAADAITTVSPTYAKEILTSEFGCGLDGLLRERMAAVSGILNGADYSLWDPAIDPHICRNYSVRTLAAKGHCKRAIQEEFGLAHTDKPLLAFMSRLVHQKMPDVLLDALPSLLESGMQFALVAEGDGDYQNGFRQLAAHFTGQVSVRIGYDERTGHRLMAGADFLLHPSRFEPCGLVPIYALRYGTVPIVRNSGGMADTVVDATADAVRSGTATGFSFEDVSADELVACVRRAADLYRQPILWRKLQQTAMRQDFGWRRPAEEYVALYRALNAGRLAPLGLEAPSAARG